MRLHDRLAVVEGAVDGDARGRWPPRPWSSCAAARRRCGRAGNRTKGRRGRGRETLRPRRRRYRPRSRRRWSVRSPRAASTWSISRARSCIATSLKASVGPWKSSSTKGSHAELRQRRDGGMAEGAVGLARHAGEIGLGDRIADETARSPRRRPRHRAGRRSRRSSAAQAAASVPAHRGRHRGQGPRASPRRSRATGLRPWSKYGARRLPVAGGDRVVGDVTPG